MVNQISTQYTRKIEWRYPKEHGLAYEQVGSFSSFPHQNGPYPQYHIRDYLFAHCLATIENPRLASTEVLGNTGRFSGRDVSRYDRFW